MANTIEARVKQKKDTLPNWEANSMILLDGEQAFVVNGSGQPINFKIGDGTKRFSDLPYWIQYDQAAFIPVSGLALPTPSQPVGYSILGEGTYTHASGGFTVPAGHWGVANWDGSAWSFSDMGSLPAPLPVSKSDISQYAYLKEEYVTQFLVETANVRSLLVNGVSVTDSNTIKEYIKKLDQSIKGFKAFGVPENNNLCLRQFSVDPAGVVGFGVSLITDINSPNTVTPIAFNSTPYINGVVSISARQQYSTFCIFAEIDTTVFGNDNVVFNLRDAGTGDVLSYKNSGIKFKSDKIIPYKNGIWGLSGFNLRNTSSKNQTQNYYIHEAIKTISFWDTKDSLVRLSGISFDELSGNIIFVIQTCLDDNPSNLVVNSSRNGFTNMRFVIPLSETGLKRYQLTIASGSNSLNGAMVFDMTYLKSKLTDISNDDISVDNNVLEANWVVKANQGGGGIINQLIIIDSSQDFQGNFRFASSTANSIYDASYNMTKVVRIPDGAENLKFEMILNGDAANAMWLDRDMKFISWVYNGSEPVTGLVSAVPVNARFVSAATQTSQTTAKIIATGVFSVNEDIKSYDSINEGLFDKYSGIYFEVNGFVYKKDKSDICTVNEFTFGNQDITNSIKEYEKDGDYIIPTGVLKTDGVTTFNGGTLCDVKNGVMYFYNANSKAIFKSNDGGITYTTIIDDLSNPGVFDPNSNTESRSSIIVMDNGELLIPIRVQGAIMQVSPERRERYWCMYRTTNNQTGLEKCFEFSHEDTLKDWLPPSDPQYMWANYSGGCMLGNFTFDQSENIIVVTEYGVGTSKYWLTQVPPVSNNARGISGRAWVSFDYGVTWAKMFDGDRKKVGTAEDNDNWYYFTSTYAAKMRHMHGVDIDKVRRTVQLTNGDNEDYIWSIDIDDLNTWYNTAVKTLPNEKPEYKETDSYPSWNSELIAPSSGSTINSYSSMRAQQMKFTHIPQGIVGAHDASREFAYLSHEVNGRNIIEPVYQFEKREDYSSDSAFAASWVSTDGFVQRVTLHNGIMYFSHSNGGTRPSRVFASANGIDWKTVYEGDNADIKFAGGIMIDSEAGAFLSDGTFGQASNISGFWKLKVKQ